ncbi:hypothetical protein D3C71_1288220 [compost metagenome]
MDAAVRAFDDALARDQPQPGAVGLGGEERIEQVRQGLRAHPGAFVGHRDAQPFLALAVAVGRRAQGQAAPLGHGLDRIQGQVQQHLLQLGVVGIHGQVVIGHVQVQAHLVGQVAAQQQFHRLEQVRDADLFAGLARAAHEGQHRFGHLVAAATALGDDVGQVVQLRVFGACLEQVRHDQQRLQDVAQVVAEPGGQQRQAFQPLRAHQLGFHPLAVDRAARIAHRTRHRRGQPRRLVLDDVVVGALVQGGDRIFLTHRAGHEDEGNIRVPATHDLQRFVAGKTGHAQVRQHDIRGEPAQRFAQLLGTLHPLETGLQAGIEHLLAHQFGVLGGVFHQQDAQHTQ